MCLSIPQDWISSWYIYCSVAHGQGFWGHIIGEHKMDRWWRYGVTKVVWLKDQSRCHLGRMCVPLEITVGRGCSSHISQLETRTKENGPEMSEIGYPALLTQEEHIPYLLNGWSESHAKGCVL